MSFQPRIRTCLRPSFHRVFRDSFQNGYEISGLNCGHDPFRTVRIMWQPTGSMRLNPLTKEIGWRGRIYQLTDSDLLTTACNCQLHSRPHQPPQHRPVLGNVKGVKFRNAGTAATAFPDQPLPLSRNDSEKRISTTDGHRRPWRKTDGNTPDSLVRAGMARRLDRLRKGPLTLTGRRNILVYARTVFQSDEFRKLAAPH